MSTVERVLVTGGCGFIGANLVRRIRDGRGWQVRVVDDLRTGRESYVSAELAEVTIGDVADPDVLEAALEGVDAVVHLASQTGVLPSVEDPARGHHPRARAHPEKPHAGPRRGAAALLDQEPAQRLLGRPGRVGHRRYHHHVGGRRGAGRRRGRR